MGLLLFIIPGVIAFAVDISNGTLYFPDGRRHSSVSTGDKAITVIRVNPAELDEKMIQNIVKERTGASIRSDLRDVEIYELDQAENIEARLTELKNSGYRIN